MLLMFGEKLYCAHFTAENIKPHLQPGIQSHIHLAPMSVSFLFPSKIKPKAERPFGKPLEITVAQMKTTQWRLLGQGCQEEADRSLGNAKSGWAGDPKQGHRDRK